MSDTEVTAAIIDCLRSRNEKHIWAEELALSSGKRRCDFWVLHPHASKGYKATAYEVKASRADFRRDTSVKQREARLFSDEFWYVAPAGLIKPEEVPDWAGLMEFHEEEEQWHRRLRSKVPAPMRDKDSPSWELVVSILRYSGDVRRDTDLIRNENALLKRQMSDMRERELTQLRA